MKAAALLALLALASCTSVIPDPRGGTLATCFSGVTTSFCRVEGTGKNTAVISGTGVLSTLTGGAAQAASAVTIMGAKP